MNERIKKLNYQALCDVMNGPDPDGDVEQMYIPAEFTKKFAELIVRECLAIARHREDELEDAGLLKESNAAGIVAYRIARQFGVKE
jgi:hypothetical protein